LNILEYVPDTTKLTAANVPPETIRCKGFFSMPNFAKIGYTTYSNNGINAKILKVWYKYHKHVQKK